MAENKPYTVEDCENLIKDYLRIPRENKLPKSIQNKLVGYLLNDEMSPKEISQCIFFYVEVKKKPLDPLYGIWFIPNIRAEAALYFEKLRAEAAVKEAEAKKFTQEEEVITFNIPAILKRKPVRKKQGLSFDKINLEDGDDSGNK